MKHISAFMIMVVACVTFLLFGLFTLFVDIERNRCYMTYMFNPELVPLDINSTRAAYYPYTLSYYRDADSHLQDMFTGQPVIYLPGNLGSASSVRSLGVVAFELALTENPQYIYDYFTVDFEEVPSLYIRVA